MSATTASVIPIRAPQSLADPLPGVPQELKDRPQWVMWVPQEAEGGHLTKVPLSAIHNERASSTKPADWADYATAMREASFRDHAGVGFVFSKDDPYTGIDLDDCVDPQGGEIQPWAQEVLDKLNSYAEISPSGKGIKLWVKARMPDGRGRRTKVDGGQIEVYSEGRYFTVTGKHLPGTPITIEARQQQLDEILSSLFPPKVEGDAALCRAGVFPVPSPSKPEDEALAALDDETIIRRAKNAKNSAKFRALWEGDWEGEGYPSQSEADAALCLILAYWANGDAVTVDRLFRQSKLFRDKWDAQRGEHTYGGRTVENACAPYARRHPQESAASADMPSLEKWMTPGTTNDAGNAARFLALYGGDVLYSRPERRWLMWDGKRWVCDAGDRVYQLGKQAMTEYLRQAVAADDSAHMKFAVNSLNDNRINAMLNSLKSEVGIDPTELDSHPLLVNFENGTLDLETGTLREHKREDYLTKIVHCEYDSTAKAPTFQKVMEHATGGSQALLDYLQRVFGYALTGKAGEKAFWVFYGPSGTGKTTVLDAIRSTFEDYSTSIQIETLMAGRNADLSNNQQSDLADLRGARFAQTSEVESGQRLKEGLIKRITQGTGKIKAARKYQEPIQFPETHKLFIDANHRPEIKDGVGVWERLHCVPFLRKVPEKEQDQGIHEKLAAERPGIAAWVMEGALAWMREGKLVKPKEVLEAGNDYRESQDVMGDWIEECCEVKEGVSWRSSDLLGSFNGYLDRCGIRRVDARKFKERLLAHEGVTWKKSNAGNLFGGIRLKNMELDLVQPAA